MKIRVGHLYPDYLNIYADRGNIAVLSRRAVLRGHELALEAVGLGDELRPGSHDLLYVGGGQDREQTLVAPDLAAKGAAIRAAVARGAALCAAGISCSAAATGAVTDSSCRGRSSSRTRPWRAPLG